MKNSKLHSLGLLAASTLIFASCGTSNKISKNGFGGSFGEGNAAKTVNKTSQPKLQEQAPVASTEVATNNAAEPTENSTAAAASAKTVQSKAPVKTSMIQKMQAIKELKKQNKSTASVNSPKDTKHDSTAMLILEVILCFIIPPLAYFLHKRAADTWFWVDLILFLIAGSWFFGLGFGGLAGLAAVVIALLAVFDVI